MLKVKLTALAHSFNPARRAVRPERLIKLTDDELAMLLRRWDWRPYVVQAVEAEATRRDRVDEKARRKAARLERRKAKERRLRSDYQDYIEASYLAAEAETRGQVLNAAGWAAGVDPKSLFSGQWSRARKYASEELLNFWAEHGRITYSEFKRQSREQRPEEPEREKVPA
ncbi:hypothetical protein [Actinomadura violacea]|uniref:Uncharacterized protein n=1 Tax=Actinomadura violacea TaxID=2819934 RepID=A0ABS3RWL6_9ACTN|nr:hypothetical protein [Actinomadura violacea]MBO2461161.1 hypothetical protein [Actinomadura violacea]